MKQNPKKKEKRSGKDAREIKSENYQLDSHHRFCERCYAYNKQICPNTRSRKKDSGCGL